MNIPMTQSIESIYNPNIKVMSKTVAIVKEAKITITTKRRESIIKAIKKAGIMTSSEIVKAINKSQSTVTGDMAFLLKPGQVRARNNKNPYPGKGKHGKQYFVPID